MSSTSCDSSSSWSCWGASTQVGVLVAIILIGIAFTLVLWGGFLRDMVFKPLSLSHRRLQRDLESGAIKERGRLATFFLGKYYRAKDDDRRQEERRSSTRPAPAPTPQGQDNGLLENAAWELVGRASAWVNDIPRDEPAPAKSDRPTPKPRPVSEAPRTPAARLDPDRRTISPSPSSRPGLSSNTDPSETGQTQTSTELSAESELTDTPRRHRSMYNDVPREDRFTYLRHQDVGPHRSWITISSTNATVSTRINEIGSVDAPGSSSDVPSRTSLPASLPEAENELLHHSYARVPRTRVTRRMADTMLGGSN